MTDGKKPTDILREEHENVLQKLDALEGVIKRLQQKEAIAGQLKDLTSFFNTDFWTHFAKEEKALFPEIEKFIPRDAGPVGVMLMEHDDLRQTNAEIQQATNEYLGSAHSLQATKILQNHGGHFIEVLRDHIHKENDILFVMADMRLNKSQVDTVLKLFKEIETSGMGKTVS